MQFKIQIIGSLSLMMRSLLAKNIANNISKSLKSNSECMFDGVRCSNNLYPGQTCIGLDSNSGIFFEKPVDVIDSEEKETKNVYMIVGGCYKLSKPFEENVYTNYLQASINHYNFYFVTKQEIELNVLIEGDVESFQSNSFYVYNPNKFSAEAEVGDHILEQNNSPSDKELSKDTPKITDMTYAYFSLEDRDNSATSISESLTIKISGNDPGDYPQKIWKIQQGLFTKDTPDDEIPDSSGDGLPPGAIAGIVIACIVVVGVAAFCIVWFVVLKKQCPCGGKSDNPEA